jgi:hypothetical protein
MTATIAITKSTTATLLPMSANIPRMTLIVADVRPRGDVERRGGLADDGAAHPNPET